LLIIPLIIKLNNIAFMMKFIQVVILIVFPVLLFSQERNIEVMPYANGTFTGKEGYVEAGPEISWKQSIWGQSILLRPAVRFPTTEANENTVQVDRYSPTWRGILAFEYGVLNNVECMKKQGFSLGLQAEYGLSKFTYYPTGNKGNPSSQSMSSFALELRFISFFSSKQINSRQLSPQFRIRYSKNATPSDITGIVNPVNNGLTTTTNMIIDKPYSTSVVSPAITVQFFPGSGYFSYSPALFYDYFTISGSNASSSFGRLRLELGIFCAPQVKINNFKIGLIPFLSFRTNGTDNNDPVIIGGQISVRFGTSFLQFF
jgi:hypothetical protein